LSLDTIPSLSRYFRSSGALSSAKTDGKLSGKQGFFRFGPETICFGRCSAGAANRDPGSDLEDLTKYVQLNDEGLILPFDPEEIAQNLRQERYVGGSASYADRYSLTRDLYYLARPWMPLAIRKYLQQIYLRGWETLPFPRWPVDRTVDRLFEDLLRLTLQANGASSIPFIWFWPDGSNACAIMTHDVEEQAGKAFCPELMSIDESYKIPASFQIVPEVRYSVEPQLLDEIRSRGFEVNVQDLNHDGRLFLHRTEFERRVKLINQYGKSFQAVGFRSAVLYRKQEWFNLLDFEYDMSVPSVAHLDPQRGGCCTIMPYFVGGLLELPVTVSQDHTLFNILNDFTLDLWRQQAHSILKHHGLMNFIVHPDYILGKKAQDAYKSLLAFLVNLREENGVWIALPKDVNRWWRQRDQMVLTHRAGNWTVQGEGSERARVAFATLQDGQLVYSFAPESKNTTALDCHDKAIQSESRARIAFKGSD
jgi:hypothetical protein